jgi:inorganic triphosphatase YgiF
VLEREIKLVVTPSFRLPALGDRFESVEAVPAEPRRLSATYFDTDDLRLARWGASLRRRTEEGWTVKLPVGANGQLLTRQELTFPGPAGRPPEAAVNGASEATPKVARALGPLASGPPTAWSRRSHPAPPPATSSVWRSPPRCCG